MKLRTLLLGGLALLLAACVSDGRPDPLSTSKGRMAARDAYIQLGVGYLQEGETARAKVPLAKALELDPRSANANAALALVFQAEMEPKLADEHFRRALSASDDSNRARILNNYGSFLYGQGRYDEALQRFSQSADDNMYASRPTVFENLGLTALKLNQADKAEGYFTRALQLDPSLPQSLLGSSTQRRRVITGAFATLPRKMPRVCCSACALLTAWATATAQKALACN